MSKRILIIGLLFCIAGVLAIWDVLFSLAKGNINLNFAVFLLPVGIGLLRGKSRSRWWANFWFILGYIGCLFLTMICTLSPANAKARFFDTVIEGPSALPYVFLVATILASGLAALQFLLNSERASQYFSRP
jgi:hypothetical protein